MKRFQKSLLMAFALSCTNLAFGQLEVLENGTTVIGEQKTENYTNSMGMLYQQNVPVDTDAQLVILGTGSYNSRGRISFGDENKVRIGEYGTSDSNQIHFHGLSGLVYTGYGDAVYLMHTANKGFQFYSPATGTAFNIRSDKRLKDNIRPITDDVWNRIYETNPVSYNYKSLNLLSESTDNRADDIAIKTAKPDDKLRYGFVAQEIKELFPDLVTTDEDGYQSIDYMGFIPLLVNAVKELKSEVVTLTNSQKRITAYENELLADNTESRLSQNNPNPFSVSSKIECKIPTTISEATVRIYDLQGKQVLRLEVEGRGNTSVNVEASTLQPGMYIYSLICDGREIDSKRMIVTE